MFLIYVMHLSSASTRGGTPGCIGEMWGKWRDFAGDSCPGTGGNVVDKFMVSQPPGEIRGLCKRVFSI